MVNLHSGPCTTQGDDISHSQRNRPCWLRVAGTLDRNVPRYWRYRDRIRAWSGRAGVADVVMELSRVRTANVAHGSDAIDTPAPTHPTRRAPQTEMAMLRVLRGVSRPCSSAGE